MARYALEKIPGAAADKALLGALNTAQGDGKFGIISSLGARKAAEAVKPLAVLLADQEPAIASASAISLGRIGGKEGAAALSEAFDKARGAFKADLASALLVCAEGCLSSQDYVSADGIFGKILSSRPPLVPIVLRQAALKGRITAASKDVARRLILETLTGSLQEMHEPAIGLVPAVFKENEITPILSLLPKLPEASQVQLLAALSGYPRDAVRPAVLAAANAASPDVRLAAVRALARVGDPSTVPLLAGQAAGSRGSEQLAARTSLWTLPGKDVDEAILFWLIASSDDPVKDELVQAVGERRIGSGKNLLIGQAESGPLSNSLAAAKALRVVASPEDIPEMLEILLGMTDETAQEEMENTIGALAQKISDPGARGDDIEGLLAPAPDSKLAPVTAITKRCLLYRTLGKIGDDSSLVLLRAALKDGDSAIQDAAVRALADWPNLTPREDVLKIAQDSRNLTHQVLALRGFVRMVGLEKYQAPEAAVRSLKTALDLSSRPDEKRLALGALADFPCPEALALAESLLTVEGVREEAAAAVDKIKENLEPKK
jgi:HEAT repeat protein